MPTIRKSLLSPFVADFRPIFRQFAGNNIEMFSFLENNALTVQLTRSRFRNRENRSIALRLHARA